MCVPGYDFKIPLHTYHLALANEFNLQIEWLLIIKLDDGGV